MGAAISNLRFKFKSLSDLEVSRKKILVRGDLDVPLKDGEVIDDFRLKTLLPALSYLLEHEAAIILIGHLGRPEGKVVESLRLKPVAEALEKLDLPISYSSILDCGEFSNQEIERLTQKGQRILLLENLRFHPQEEENDHAFAGKLASLGEIFINEAFADSHREHASIVGIPKFLPSFAGFQFAKEVEKLSKILENPGRPLVFIIGGAKGETKIPLVKKFAKIADTILVAGELMFARELEGIPHTRFPVDAVGVNDIGPRSVELFQRYIRNAQTIVWSGPLGRFEEEKYAQGTREVAAALVESKAEVIIGGGDTVAALDKFGLLYKLPTTKFISTGGGAMLELLADGTLPGIEALNRSQSAII